MTRFVWRYWRVSLGAVWLLGVGFLTLRPGGMRLEELAQISLGCLLCGDRGTADAILNVVLFVPLGAVLGGGRGALRRAGAAGLAVSFAIELVQVFVPGRHSSLADLLWNTTGAVVGALVYVAVRRRLTTPVRMGGLGWGTFLAAAFALAGALVIPAPTDDAYWGQWTPDLGSMPQYDGQVLEALLNGRPLRFGRIEAPPPHDELLRGDWTLAGELVVGAPSAAVSPILSIYDGHRREIVLLGAHNDDLVFRERLVAHRVGLERPDIRIPGAFAPFDAGDTTRIEARRSEGAVCLRLGDLERCGLGTRLGRTWGLLLYVEGPPERFRELVDVGWLMVLFLPLGFFAVSARNALGGLVAAAGGVVVAVGLTPLLPPTWLHVLAGLSGAAFGRLGFVLLRSAARGQPAPLNASIDASV